MEIKELREEAEKMGYYLLSVHSGLTDDDIIRIACMATSVPVESFKKKTRESRIVLARYLASHYWAVKCGYNETTIAELTGMHRTVVYYARRVLSDDIKFFKLWQQEAIRDFNDAIQKAQMLKNEAA